MNAWYNTIAYNAINRCRIGNFTHKKQGIAAFFFVIYRIRIFTDKGEA